MAMRGWLWKKGVGLGAMTGKKKRYFELREHKLRYFTDCTESGEPSGEMKGTIDLEEMTTIRRDDDTVHLNTMTKGPGAKKGEHREWVLKAIDVIDAKRWQTAITTSKAGRADVMAPGRPGEGEEDADAAGREEEHQGRLLQEQMQRQQLSPDELAETIQERDDAMAKIESTMMEVNDIYRDLGTLVHDQGAVLDSIESNIDATDGKVEAGIDELNQGGKYLGIRKR